VNHNEINLDIQEECKVFGKTPK